jgi:hypothetical protein
MESLEDAFAQFELFGSYLTSIGGFIRMALKWIDGPQPEGL